MLKKALNELRIIFNIETRGPFLIKKGGDNQQQGQSNELMWVKDANGNIFIPGSSIRGAWRSRCEQIARTIGDAAIPLVCKPYDDAVHSPHRSCSKRLEGEDPATVYALSCPVCKLFGSTAQGSRIKMTDAYPTITPTVLKRPGISIDRFTGGNDKLFSYEYVIGATFKTEIVVRNFELWHIGLLAFVLRDFQEELIPIGFAKSRGFGKVRGSMQEATISYFGLKKPSNDATKNQLTIWGVGRQYDDTDRGNYCFADEPPLVVDSINYQPTGTIVKQNITLDAASADRVIKSCAPYWAGQDASSSSCGYFLHAKKGRENVFMEEAQNV